MPKPRSRRRIRQLIAAIESGIWSPAPYWLNNYEVLLDCLKWADGQRVPMVDDRLKAATKQLRGKRVRS